MDAALAQAAFQGNPYRILEKGLTERLGKKPLGYIVYHDLPIQTGGSAGTARNLQLEFLKRGLDPNDGMITGRFVPTEFHIDVLHGGKTADLFGPSGGAWNYQWVRFFEENPTANGDQILAFLDELISRTSDFTKSSVDDIDWLYYP